MSEKKTNNKIDEINKIVAAIREELSSINHTKTISNFNEMMNFSEDALVNKNFDAETQILSNETHEPVSEPEEPLSGLEALVYKAIKDYIRPMIDAKIKAFHEDRERNFLDILIEQEVKNFIDKWMQKNLFTYINMQMGHYCKEKIDTFFEKK